MDLLVSKVKRVIEVCQDHRGRQVQRVILAFLVLLVLWDHLALLDCLVLKVQRELKGQQVLLARRVMMDLQVPLDLQVHLVKLSNPCQSDIQKRQSEQLLIQCLMPGIIFWTMLMAWRKYSVP